MPIESEPAYVEPAPEAQLDSSKVWLCKKAFQGLKISPQAWHIYSTQKVNDMNYNQLISDPSMYVKKRAQRSDDSILLRHMDDVVGTGPDEHLMSDFEHMMTSLYLTDVVVLRHESGTVNFLGLEITKTRKGFEVKNSADLVQSLLNLYRLQNSKPTVNPGRRTTVMELTWRPDTPFAFQQLPTQVLNPTTESLRAVKQLIRYLEGKQHTCLLLEPREMVQTGLLELVGRSDSDCAGNSATRQGVTGYHCDVQNVTMCNRSLKQTAISLSPCEAEFYAASACAGQLLGLAELFKERHYNVSVRLEMDSDSARHILQRTGPGGLKHIELRCSTIQLFTKHLDGLRTRALA